MSNQHFQNPWNTRKYPFTDEAPHSNQPSQRPRDMNYRRQPDVLQREPEPVSYYPAEDDIDLEKWAQELDQSDYETVYETDVDIHQPTPPPTRRQPETPYRQPEAPRRPSRPAPNYPPNERSYDTGQGRQPAKRWTPQPNQSQTASNLPAEPSLRGYIGEPITQAATMTCPHCRQTLMPTVFEYPYMNDSIVVLGCSNCKAVVGTTIRKVGLIQKGIEAILHLIRG